MPTTPANGIDLHYVESGQGDTVVMAHGLLMDHSMFDPQRRALAETYRVIAYDHRGQGESAPAASGYDLDTLAEDAVDLIRSTSAAPCHFVGMSMGGFVAIRLAARYPELLRSLVLINTSASAEPWLKRLRFRAMQAFAGLFGPGPMVGALLPVMFGETFRKDSARQAERERWIHHVRSLPRRIVGPVGGVIGRESVIEELRYIRCPTLIITGDEDHTTPVSEAERMASAIGNARLLRIPHCGHSSPIEAPQVVSEALLSFFAECG